MKIIGGLGAILLLMMAAGWLANHITGGMILALVIVLWLGFVGWMIHGYCSTLGQEGKQHGGGRTSRRSADR
jgi:hypothetical protein